MSSCRKALSEVVASASEPQTDQSSQAAEQQNASRRTARRRIQLVLGAEPAHGLANALIAYDAVVGEKNVSVVSRGNAQHEDCDECNASHAAPYSTFPTSEAKITAPK